MNIYECFYKSKRITIEASRPIDAQEEAAKIFKARKRWEVTVVLAAKGDAPVIHNPAIL